jgi:hypothetical protein
VRIDQSQRKWLIASIAILAVATAVYIPYATRSLAGPRGGSPLGLAYGIVGSAFMAFAGLLAARKKVPVWRLGRAQTWMRGHLWLGLLSLPLILFHGGFHFGGPLTTVLMVLLIFVIASGVFGAVFQHYLPRTMTIEVPMETIFEQIDHVRTQLRAEAVGLVSAACAARSDDLKEDEGGVIVETAVTAEQAAPLQAFYARQLQPFLENPSGPRHLLSDPQQAAALFEELRTLLPVPLHPAVSDLESICEEQRQLTRQVRLHRWLHAWLLLHIPLSFALLLLGAAHAVMALHF